MGRPIYLSTDTFTLSLICRKSSLLVSIESWFKVMKLVDWNMKRPGWSNLKMTVSWRHWGASGHKGCKKAALTFAFLHLNVYIRARKYATRKLGIRKLDMNGVNSWYWICAYICWLQSTTLHFMYVPGYIYVLCQCTGVPGRCVGIYDALVGAIEHLELCHQIINLTVNSPY